MPSIINASSTGSGGIVQTADASGVLQLQSNGTTALTVSGANVTFAGTQTLTNNITTTGSINALNTFGFENRIINGAMVIDQRNAGAAYTNSNQALYGLDRWRSYGLSGAVLTVQQSTTAPAGFSNSQSVTVTTSTTANDGGGLSQLIEANNVFDLNWGTSSGVAVTASFWVRASVTGTYNVYLRYLGSTATYYYVATYTVNVANTWEQKTLNISAPPVGAGAFTAALNSSYLEFRPAINSSGNTTTVTGNTWSTTNAAKTAGSVDLASNAGATFYITGVQLEKGTQATSFDFRSIGQELALCQRYFQKFGNDGSVGEVGIASGFQTSTTAAAFVFKLTTTMRAKPVLAASSLAVSNQVNISNAATLVTSSVNTDGGTVYTSYAAFGAQYQPVVLCAISLSSGFFSATAEL
jgi:hypothetical protein